MNEPNFTSNISIFSNMFSLLHPRNNLTSLLTLKLPNIFNAQEEPELPLTPSPTRELPQRKCKEVTACPHTERKHYAKNMCNNCYHRNGRDKNAWICPHTDRQLYAKGKCQFCYLQKYHSSKVFGKRRSRSRKRVSRDN